jgi:hypothetical protein
MKNCAIWLVLTGCSALAACQPETGAPMEFSKACARENEKRLVEMNGFLSAGRTVYCSNRSGRMECGYSFSELPSAEKGITAYIEQGSGANAAEKLQRNYKREDVRIRDDGGNLIKLADRVKVTGKLNVTPDLSTCFIDVTRIHR